MINRRGIGQGVVVHREEEREQCKILIKYPPVQWFRFREIIVFYEWHIPRDSFWNGGGQESFSDF